MAFRIRKVIGTLAIAGLLAATPLGVGCSGGDGGSERAVEWAIDRIIGPKAIRLAATVGVCFKPVQLEQPIIEYAGHRVYIELRHTPEEGEGGYGGCLLSLSTLHKAITLERDLDELVLFDASTDPPSSGGQLKIPCRNRGNFDRPAPVAISKAIAPANRSLINKSATEERTP